MSEASDAPATDSGPLSVEAAVEMLMPAEEAAPEEAAAPEAEDPEIEASPEAEAPDAPEEASETEEEGEVEAAPAVEPPPFWAADDKEAFAQLSPELQAKVLGYEKNRDAATSKAIQEAAQARKAIEQDASKVAELAATLDKLIPAADAALGRQWPAEVDWVGTLNTLTEQYGVEDGMRQYLGLKEQFDQDQKTIAAAQAAKQAADDLAVKTFLQTEFENLKVVAPALADPKDGPARLQSVGKYLTAHGIAPEQLRNVSAVEMSIAHKAMLWDEAQAAAAKPKAPKPAATAAVPARRPVTPAAAQPVSTPAKRTAATAANRYAQTRSVDDAVEFLLAKKAS